MTQATRTLITDIHTLLPMTGTREGPRVSIQNAAVLIEGGVILWVGHAGDLICHQGLRGRPPSG